MKKSFGFVLAGLVLATTLVGCGGREPSTSEQGSEVVITTSRDNNNTDPYAGWVKLVQDGWSADTVYFTCTKDGTGIYRTWDDRGGLAAIPNSPDCPKR